MPRPWVQTLGSIDFTAPAVLYEAPCRFRGEPHPGRVLEGLTLAQAVHMALASDPELHPYISLACDQLGEVLDFDHIRGLHGHPDFARARAAP